MSDDLAKLRADYAELLGKTPFNGWGAEELQKRIDAALSGPKDPDGNPASNEAPSLPAPKAAKPSAKEKLIAVTIKRDFWDKDGNRHRKGTIAEVPVEAALDGAESGALSRVKG